MKLILICFLICLGLELTQATILASYVHDWKQYKLKHGLVFNNQQEDAHRLGIFMRNQQFVNDQNANLKDGKEPLKLSATAHREVHELCGLNSADKRYQHSPEDEKFLDKLIYVNSGDLPEEFDWRKFPGRVTPIKDQKLCGSCWAFSATGALEGRERINGFNKSRLVGLSEQLLVDCAKIGTLSGCYGGDIFLAFQNIKQLQGIEDEQTYPYVAKETRCRFNVSKVVMTDSGAIYLPSNQPKLLKKTLVEYGPVSVSILAGTQAFINYNKGVYSCNTEGRIQVDHGVLIVGYGSNKTNGEFWIVKNSWGPSWGESGYFKLAIDPKLDCGASSNAVIATF